MNLVLMGYRGCGKTTAGLILARRLEYRFVDLDEAVCEYFGAINLREVFQRYGEAAFREAEQDVLEEQLARSQLVLALGGGTPVQPRARRVLSDAGGAALRVYLRCGCEELYRRVQADAKFTAARPSQSQLGSSVTQIESLVAEREPTYLELADLVVDATGGDPEATAGRIMEHHAALLAGASGEEGT